MDGRRRNERVYRLQRLCRNDEDRLRPHSVQRQGHHGNMHSAGSGRIKVARCKYTTTGTRQTITDGESSSNAGKETEHEQSKEHAGARRRVTRYDEKKVAARWTGTHRGTRNVTRLDGREERMDGWRVRIGTEMQRMCEFDVGEGDRHEGRATGTAWLRPRTSSRPHTANIGRLNPAEAGPARKHTATGEHEHDRQSTTTRYCMYEVERAKEEGRCVCASRYEGQRHGRQPPLDGRPDESTTASRQCE